MPSQSRVLFCRLGVVVFCLLPTATVGGWIAHRTSGQFAIAQKAEWERELSRRLGLTVHIGTVSYPSPAGALLGDVRLLDPETQAPVAKAAALSIGELVDGYVVEASQLSIEASQLDLLGRKLESHILRAPLVEAREDAVFSILLVPSDLSICQAGRCLSLLQFTGTLHASQYHVEWTSDFQLPGDAPTAEPLRLTVTRNRAATPETTWHLDTAGRALPCEMFVDAIPPVKRLGENCTFTGRLECVDSAAGLSSLVTGTLENVDLDSLVTEHFPHQLSGLATVKIERAALDRGKLAEIRGTIQAHDGAISHSLLAAAQEHLRLVLAADNSSIQPGRVISYRQLSLGFALDGRALALTGSADPTQPGVLLANAAGPLLQAPPQHAAPPVNLLRTLVPENEYQVPATRQTDTLVSLLPVPDLAAPQTAARPSAHVPARLAPSAPGESAPAIRQPKLR